MLTFRQELKYLRATLRANGCPLGGLTVIDGWETAVMMIRLGKAIPPVEFYYPGTVSADSTDGARRGPYNVRIENMGGKRRRVTGGYVAPENVDHFIENWASMGLLVDNRKKR